MAAPSPQDTTHDILYKLVLNIIAAQPAGPPSGTQLATPEGQGLATPEGEAIVTP